MRAQQFVLFCFTCLYAELRMLWFCHVCCYIVWPLLLTCFAEGSLASGRACADILASWSIRGSLRGALGGTSEKLPRSTPNPNPPPKPNPWAFHHMGGQSDMKAYYKPQRAPLAPPRAPRVTRRVGLPYFGRPCVADPAFVELCLGFGIYSATSIGLSLSLFLFL